MKVGLCFESRAMRDSSPHCGTGVLARQIAKTAWKLAKLHGRESLATPVGPSKQRPSGAPRRFKEFFKEGMQKQSVLKFSFKKSSRMVWRSRAILLPEPASIT
jgi:hypothetical protein